MAKFTLTIETEDASELHDLTGRIAGTPLAVMQPLLAQIEEKVREEAAAEEVATGEAGKRKRRTKAEMEAARNAEQPAGTPATSTETPASGAAAPQTSSAPSTLPTAGDTPEISPDALKDLLVQLMDKKGAGYAQGVIRAAAPGKSALSQLAPEERFPVYQAFQSELAKLA